MGKSIYLLSAEPYSGKSVIIVGLGLKFKDEGYKVGYFKPFGTGTREYDESGREILRDEDVYSVKQVLGLKEPLEQLCPVLVTTDLVSQILTNKTEEDFLKKIVSTFSVVAKDKDLIFIDGVGDCSEGYIFGASCQEIVNQTKSKVLFVLKYAGDTSIDAILSAKEIFKDNFLGAIVNYIPQDKVDYFEKVIVPYLERKKIEVFALFPKDILLAAISVKEIVEHLDGRVLCAEDKLNELVENFVVGAMHPEQALKYFRKITDKAVITGGDRADIQTAALETATKCLILTGNLTPDSLVLSKANELGVPMILVGYDTFTTVERIEEISKKIPFHGEKKIERVKKLFAERFDFKKFKTYVEGKN